MSESDQTIDVYYDMEIAEICQQFNKSRNTVDKAVAKMVKDFPDKGWKYKNPKTRRITIKAEGVEHLSKYFRKEKHEVSTVEIELRYENEKLKAILEEKEKKEKQLEAMYQERLQLELEKSRQSFLLESQSKDHIIEEKQLEIDEKQTEIDEKKNVIEEKENQISEHENKISDLEYENQKLKDDTKEMEELRNANEAYKKKEEEYNSKSFFYRLTHKI